MRRQYLAQCLWTGLLLLLSWHSRAFGALVAIETALIFYIFNLFRNTRLEAQLRVAVENVTGGVDSICVAYDPPRIKHASFNLIIENPTSVPVIIREVRLRTKEDMGECRPLYRLNYFGPTRHVHNDDPDIWSGDYLSPRTPEESLEEERYYGLGPPPRDFHEIPSQCAAMYGWPAEMTTPFAKKTLVECLVFAEYPTIFGGRKVLKVVASEHTVNFVSKLIQDCSKRLADAKEKLPKEQEGPSSQLAD